MKVKQHVFMNFFLFFKSLTFAFGTSINCNYKYSIPVRTM